MKKIPDEIDLLIVSQYRDLKKFIKDYPDLFNSLDDETVSKYFPDRLCFRYKMTKEVQHILQNTINNARSKIIKNKLGALNNQGFMNRYFHDLDESPQLPWIEFKDLPLQEQMLLQKHLKAAKEELRKNYPTTYASLYKEGVIEWCFPKAIVNAELVAKGVKPKRVQLNKNLTTLYASPEARERLRFLSKSSGKPMAACLDDVIEWYWICKINPNGAKDK